MLSWKQKNVAGDKIIILKLAIYLLEKNVSGSSNIGGSFFLPQGDFPNNALFFTFLFFWAIQGPQWLPE